MISTADSGEGTARRRAVRCLIPILLLVLAGCSTYSDRNAKLRGDLTALDFEQALIDVEEAPAARIVS